MSHDLNAIRPGVGEAVAVSSKKQRYVNPSQPGERSRNNCHTLVSRCRSVVVANLERYPPIMFQMLAEPDWDDIVRCKHEKTAPQKGSGGLDGTGRRAPALSERFMTEVETENDHLRESTVSDELIWKDCVEFRFKRGGLTRPRALEYPWPVLVQEIKELMDVLIDMRKKEDAAEKNGEQLMISGNEEANLIGATLRLRDSPMNVSLLKESGVGVQIKKIIKKANDRTHKSVFRRVKLPSSGNNEARGGPNGDSSKEKRVKLPSSGNNEARGGPNGDSSKEKQLSVLKQLDKLLQAWMDLAASKGVAVEGSGNSAAAEQFKKDDAGLQRAEKCKSWRQLFATLKELADEKRLNLASKMRENRKKENSQRPQIVKVRPANRRREAILDGSSASSGSNWGSGGGTVGGQGGTKMLQLRKEASMQSAREKSRPSSFKNQSGFGAAVAFAANSKLTAKQKQLQQQKKRKANPIVPLGGGKRMAVPQRPMRMQNTGSKPLIAKKPAKPAVKPQPKSRR